MIQVQTHLAEAMRRMRDAAGGDENVDRFVAPLIFFSFPHDCPTNQNLGFRRLITNLVVSFLAAPRGDAKRFEILNVIGSVLRFSEEERYKVGLPFSCLRNIIYLTLNLNIDGCDISFFFSIVGWTSQKTTWMGHPQRSHRRRRRDTLFSHRGL